ncbi:MAG: ribosome silencing factor [Treponema sp.]|nr:ribosome silencing factor [Treponema sp.]
MEDMLPAINGHAKISSNIAALLQQHKGEDVTVLDLRDRNEWTDFFIIATVTSGTHLDGLERHIKIYCREQGIDILRQSPRFRGQNTDQRDEWHIIDLGSSVIHLMSSNARNFYDLERLHSM